MEVAGGGSSSQRGGDGAAGGGGGGAEEEEETGPGCVSASEGLEEGEVEGETLLIVEAEEEQEHDQASLDLSHDQSGDSLNSEDAAEDAETSGGGSSWSEDTTAFHCDKCHKWIPSGQLRGEQPSYLKGDNFFKFTCSDCAEDGKESFERMRLTWQQVVMLAMYNLSLEGTGRQGYFRWKEDICAFIGRHWNFLLGSRKKTSTWWSTVAGCLSVGSPTFFRSGAQEFGEPGWWKLVQNRPPTLRPDGDKTSVAALKAKAPSKPALDPTITVEGLRKRGGRNPVESAMQLKEKRSRTQEAKDIRRAQKEAASGSSSAGYGERSGLMVVSGGYGSGGSSSTSSTPVKMSSSSSSGAAAAAGGRGGRRGGGCGGVGELVLEKGEVIDFSSMSSSDRTPLTSPSPSPSPDLSAPGTPASHSATPSLLSEADLIPDAMPPQALFHDDEELDGEGMIDPGMESIPPPSASSSGAALVVRKKLRPAELIKQEAESDEEDDDEDGHHHHLHHHHHHHHHHLLQQQQHRARLRGNYHHRGGMDHHQHHLHDDHPSRADRKKGLGAMTKGDPDGSGAGGMTGPDVAGTPLSSSSSSGLLPVARGDGGGGGGDTSSSSASRAAAPRLAFLGLYEERALLRRLEACPQALAVTAEARRLRRKLLVRQAQRERGRPLLDLDQAVSAALSLVGGVYGGVATSGGGGGVGGPERAGAMTMTKYRTNSQDTRILDRFQTAASGRKGFQQHSVSFWHRLMGSDISALEQGIKSPYTSRVLKPFIRRDYETRPLKMRLLAEIRARGHRHDDGWNPGPDAPIDYCYVRPNHIPSVNAMCHDMFWPGVDLSECLQYPDFSVVVLYKKVVIGFGFMVPDVKYNEAYISFLLVHPEWRRAGIATFMIYHLIQTCMGKDVTLHVSASNPAMLLYQKLGFKTEEYILDFYDKYYPVDSKECRHAFFLRLRR
ncbi:cysteine-rich protein 2-binding protein [Alosa sapidissima]|uniref:cysteine-rich protein 2-binding protein n=1 Tax=Alosa sapidissima TaxID=34773 RepID=UPI001C0907CE|nr:cysteine-rich protein 2-binding protein [Alosa sapidissima]